jgi:putative Mg2+ transporter-C (MgtC) family protein
VLKWNEPALWRCTYNTYISRKEQGAAMMSGLPEMIDVQQLMTELLRIGLAVILGGLIGLERQIHGRWTGLRTHMGVSVGSAVFTLVGLELAPLPLPDATRVVPGVAAGIGFLGAGTILKLSDQVEVKGLTTASSIWLTAAVGTAAGLGLFSLAISTTVVTLIVLAIVRPLEKRFPAHAD